MPDTNAAHDSELIRGAIAKLEETLAYLRGLLPPQPAGALEIRARHQGSVYFVQGIKAVRNLTGWGLKESKDFLAPLLGEWDQSFQVRKVNQHAMVLLSDQWFSPGERLVDFIQEMDLSGFEVTVV